MQAGDRCSIEFLEQLDNISEKSMLPFFLNRSSRDINISVGTVCIPARRLGEINGVGGGCPQGLPQFFGRFSDILSKFMEAHLVTKESQPSSKKRRLSQLMVLQN